MQKFDEIQSGLNKLQSDYQRDAFEAHAEKKGIRYPKAAAKLANYNGASLDVMLTDVLAEHPYLNAEKREPKEIGGPSNHGEESAVIAGKADTVALKQAFAKAKASGSIDERVRYAQLARKLRGE